MDKENIRLLLVDYNSKYLDHLSLTLKESRFSNFYKAFSGEKAIQSIFRYDPQIILMDTFMKGITGYEACKRIREMDQGIKRVIIGLSMDDYGTYWTNNDANHFFRKRDIFGNNLLVEKIEKEYLNLQMNLSKAL